MVNNIGNVAAGATRGVPVDVENAIQLYSGEVILNFDRKTVFTELIKTKTIPHGNSTSFPLIGMSSDEDTNTHVPGTVLTMSAIPVKERIINIDALEYFALAVDFFEEKILHFEVRGELAKQAGEALAVKIEKQAGKMIALASQTSGTIGTDVVQPDGSEVVNDLIATATGSKAKGDALIESIFAGVALMEDKDVTGEKYVVVSPLTYSYLVQSDAINKDVTSGSNGGLDTGKVMEVAGVKIYKSNYMPADAIDGKKVQAMLFTSECACMVKLVDITSEHNYIPEQLATLLTTYYSYGMGVLKPACSCVILGGTV